MSKKNLEPGFRPQSVTVSSDPTSKNPADIYSVDLDTGLSLTREKFAAEITSLLEGIVKNILVMGTDLADSSQSNIDIFIDHMEQKLFYPTQGDFNITEQIRSVELGGGEKLEALDVFYMLEAAFRRSVWQLVPLIFEYQESDNHSIHALSILLAASIRQEMFHDRKEN